MRSQQEAERREQQRIKSLVLNYDLTDGQHDGEEPAFHYVQSPASNRTVLVGRGSLNQKLHPKNIGQSQRSTSADEINICGGDNPIESDIKRHDSFADDTGHIDHPHTQPRQDKSGNSRSKQRARKLQLGDIDWYGDHSRSATPQPQPAQAALDDFVKEKKSQSSRAPSGAHRRKRKG
jgi:regulator of nonsense transcripts 2